MGSGQSTQIEIGGRRLTLETGRVAKQADGSVIVRYGDTVVLATVVASRVAVEGQDFSRSPWTTGSARTRADASPGASSSARDVPSRRRSSPRASSTVP